MKQKKKFNRLFNKWIFYFLFLIATIFIVVYLPNPLWQYPDGIGYYSYLPAIFSTKDYDFLNVMKSYSPFAPLCITQKGFVLNEFGIGCSVTWLPAYLLSLGFESEKVGIVFVNFLSSLLGLLSLFLIYKTLLFLGADKKISALICIFVLIGTPLLFYIYIVPQSPHTVTAFLCSIYLFYWIITIGQVEFKRFAILGLLLGLATSVREQEILFGVTIFNEVLYKIIKTKQLKRYFLASAVLLLMFLVGVSPYVMNSLILFGRLTVPRGYIISLKDFSLSFVYEVLFSSYHSVVLWTPIMFLSLVGLILGLSKNILISISCLLIFVLQVFVISLALPAPGGGWSFGVRYLTDSILIFSLGLMHVFQYLKNKKLKYVLLIICCGTCLWSLILLLLAAKGCIDLLEVYHIKTFFTLVYKNLLPTVKSISLKPRYIEFTEYWVFFLSIFIFSTFLMRKTYRLLTSKTNYKLLLVFLVNIYILFFNIHLLKSGVINRVVYRKYDEFVSLTDYQNFYLLAGLRVRLKYYKVTNQPQMYNYYLKLRQKIKFQSPKMREITKNLLVE